MLPRRINPTLFVVAAAAVAIGVGLLSAWATLQPKEEPDSPPREVSPEQEFAGVTSYAINQPPTRQAADASLADEEEVIGVSVNCKYRAYRIRALSGDPRWHVVNDWLGDAPVSVVHCDRTECSTVFTDKGAKAPLNLTFGGWSHNSLLLRADGALYTQSMLQPIDHKRGPFPFAPASFMKTTWKEWRTAHPDTDVYVGVGE